MVWYLFLAGGVIVLGSNAIQLTKRLDSSAFCDEVTLESRDLRFMTRCPFLFVG